MKFRTNKSNINSMHLIGFIAVMALVCFGFQVLFAGGAGKTGVQQKKVPKMSFSTKTTTSGSVFIVAKVSDTQMTGHGNVRFKVIRRWNICNPPLVELGIWAKKPNSDPIRGYRQWFDVTVQNVFGTWVPRGGNGNVAWPPNFPGFNSSMQFYDIDGDGDLDTFQLVETAPKVWTVFLYKNTN